MHYNLTRLKLIKPFKKELDRILYSLSSLDRHHSKQSNKKLVKIFLAYIKYAKNNQHIVVASFFFNAVYL